MVCGAFRSFPRLGLVWVRRLTQTLTQTALKPKWRKNAIFRAVLEQNTRFSYENRVPVELLAGLEPATC